MGHAALKWRYRNAIERTVSVYLTFKTSAVAVIVAVYSFTALLSCRILSSSEVLSTDEESSESGGESEDELGKSLEALLSSKKTATELSHEQEEIERQELRRLLLEDQPVSVVNQVLMCSTLSLSID